MHIKQVKLLFSTVKYEAPQSKSASWSRNNLSLSWPAAEKDPALAEVWFRQDGHPGELWEKVRGLAVCSVLYLIIFFTLFATLQTV